MEMVEYARVIVFALVSTLVWNVGFGALADAHFKRVGKKPKWYIPKWMAFQFAALNAFEWCMMFLLFIGALLIPGAIVFLTL